MSKEPLHQPRQHLPFITNYQEYNGHASIKIKSEKLDTKDSLKSAHATATSATTTTAPPPFEPTDHMSCVYKSESPTSKTILITTNNYSQTTRCSDGSLRTNATPHHIKNNSSITIFTHNPPSSSSDLATSNVNILINNHFNEAPPPPPSSSSAADHHHQHPVKLPFTHIHIPTPTAQLSSGDEVFVRLHDDRFHLGSIVTATLARCLVRFPDNTERWTDRGDVQRLSAQDVLPTCIVCKSSKSADTIAKCAKCGRAYHPECVGASVDGVWFCRRGHRNVVATAGDGKSGAAAALETTGGRLLSTVDEVKRTRQLPYHLKSLTWDAAHHQNDEQLYCYCGNNGEWFMQMLQCAHCQQWFHEKCLDLQYPLYCGDRFYVFVCALCNHGDEFVRRLQMRLDDLVHLLLYNLSVNNARRYFDVTKVIVPYAINNWHALQLLPALKSMSFAEIKDKIVKTLQTNANRFKCRTSNTPKSASTQYCLRTRIAPPAAPTFAVPLPVNGQPLTEKVVRDYLRDKAKLLPKSTTCDIGACGDEMRYTMTGKAFFNLPTIAANRTAFTTQPDCTEDHCTSDDDDEVLANIAVGKKSLSDHSSTVSSSSASTCLPPTPPTSESRPATPTGSTTVDSDIYDYCSAKEDSPDIVLLRPKLLLTQHKRKRGRPFGSVKHNAQLLLAAQHGKLPLLSTLRTPVAPPSADPSATSFVHLAVDRATSSSFGYSSDDNSSRGTLDLIIPPPKDFQGINNPFLSQIRDPPVARSKAGAKGKKGAAGTSQIRLVRTVKRRLSARDIVIGPNMEVKRRKIRRLSGGHVEVISTSTILQTIGAPSSAKQPMRTDFKDLALSGSSSTTTHHTHGLSPPPPPPPPPMQHVFRPEEAYGIGGRRLRKRGDTNYAETRRHAANAAAIAATTSSSSSSGNAPSSSSNSTASLGVVVGATLNQIPGAGGSPVKGGAEVSLTELQSSLTMYFGAANRIANGERFAIKGRRVGVDGRNQFLIEWDTVA